ncbi:chlorite dismutase family protein [Halopiger aswanensis]|uniref:Chlorite dismutase n=1 Tax=Halopiger aswanensis TaxID=148449 RepID=A0A3R7KJG8_9EURY|nr:chlorite dismutase family protein [Halopiger aswanensis]RKD93358.1 chlorite dismutase [Halopiger aswanensis]
MGTPSRDSDPLEAAGAYGLFAAFELDRSRTVDASAVSADDVEAVLKDRNGTEPVLADTYLTQGLTPDVDYLVRLHARDLATAQEVLREFRTTPIGRCSELVDAFVGAIRDPVYLPQAPDLDAIETAISFEGAEPPEYAIVIPVRKTAEWWMLPPDDRLARMREHIEVSLPYLDRIRRQLYHASGLSEYEFVTYFETNDLEAFVDLYRDLESIPEYRYVDEGPVVIGRPESPSTVVEKLTPLLAPP